MCGPAAIASEKLRTNALLAAYKLSRGAGANEPVDSPASAEASMTVRTAFCSFVPVSARPNVISGLSRGGRAIAVFGSEWETLGQAGMLNSFEPSAVIRA